MGISHRKKIPKWGQYMWVSDPLPFLVPSLSFPPWISLNPSLFLSLGRTPVDLSPFTHSRSRCHTHSLSLSLSLSLSSFLILSPQTSFFLLSFLLRQLCDQPSSVTLSILVSTRTTRRTPKHGGPSSVVAQTLTLGIGAVRGGVVFSRLWSAVLWPVLMVNLGANLFISTASSRQYLSFSMKILISLARSSMQIKNFVSRFEPNETLFWSSDLELILVIKNVFQRYIISLCLVLFVKSHIFKTNCENFRLKFVSFYV